MKTAFKKKIRRVALFHKSSRPKIKSKVQKLLQFLKGKGLECAVAFCPPGETLSSLSPPADLVVCLGGDGACLKAFKYAKDIPVLGINMGSLGFLTPYEEGQSFQLLEKTLAGQMFLKKKRFLKSYVYDIPGPVAFPASRALKPPALPSAPPQKDRIFYAVNDVVLERGSASRLVPISVFINKEYIYSLRSDGLIVSTPTGSTAYNLAAGGPILHHKAGSYVISPICSHSLTNRPVVIPDSSKICLILKSESASLTIDGQRQAELSPKRALFIQKAKESFYSVVEKEDKSFALLREKLKFGRRD